MVKHDIETVAKAKTVIMELHPNLLQNGQSQIPFQMKDKGFVIKQKIGNVLAGLGIKSNHLSNFVNVDNRIAIQLSKLGK